MKNAWSEYRRMILEILPFSLVVVTVGIFASCTFAAMFLIIVWTAKLVGVP